MKKIQFRFSFAFKECESLDKLIDLSSFSEFIYVFGKGQFLSHCIMVKIKFDNMCDYLKGGIHFIIIYVVLNIKSV